MSNKLFHQVDDMQVILRRKGGVYSDRLSRSGRRSWRKINAALEAIPIAYGSTGDGR